MNWHIQREDPFPFQGRQDAGKRLAALLKDYERHPTTIVLGIPRGGVVVAYEVATKLSLPLDVIVAHKLGAPGFPELAMGAITKEVCLLNKEVIFQYNISQEEIAAETKRQRIEMERREALYRQGRPFVSLEGKTVILIDDGIATGETMRAACEAVRQKGAETLIVAVPVSSPTALSQLTSQADRIVCINKPFSLNSIGEWYEDFRQVDDATVIALLKLSAKNAD